MNTQRESVSVSVCVCVRAVRLIEVSVPVSLYLIFVPSVARKNEATVKRKSDRYSRLPSSPTPSKRSAKEREGVSFDEARLQSLVAKFEEKDFNRYYGKAARSVVISGFGVKVAFL